MADSHSGQLDNGNKFCYVAAIKHRCNSKHFPTNQRQSILCLLILLLSTFDCLLALITQTLVFVITVKMKINSNFKSDTIFSMSFSIQFWVHYDSNGFDLILRISNLQSAHENVSAKRVYQILSVSLHCFMIHSFHTMCYIQ